MNLNSLALEIFHKLQKPLRFIYFIFPDSIRFGKAFRDKSKSLELYEWKSEAIQQEKQLKELKKIIKHAYETVPYYNNLFKSLNIKPSDIHKFEDIQKIPYLTKDIIRNNFEDLISREYKLDNLVKVSTGGSTGLPLTFLIDPKQDRNMEWAFVTHLWSRVGYDITKSNSRLILMGAKPRKGFFEKRNRNMIMSSHDLTYNKIPAFIKAIEDFNPKFIHCYPSSIEIICDYMRDHNIKLRSSKLKAVLCVSEVLTASTRKKIEDVFGVGVYSFYGHSEHAAMAGQCEKSNFYHIEPLYGYTELIKEDNSIANKDNEVGEIVATSFINYAMPFIRYKTGDLAVNSLAKCSCGRNHKIIKEIKGREKEYFISFEGNKITVTGIYKILSLVDGKIVSGQFQQKQPGEVILKVITKGEFDKNDFSSIYDYFYSTYGDKIILKIEQVEVLERTVSGKLKFLDQQLKI